MDQGLFGIDFFVAFDDCLELDLGSLASLIVRSPRRRVGSVTMEELCRISDYPHGLYLLFDRENIVCYVGKATSRSFIERIPAHFDSREAAWFNTIPKRVMRDYGLDRDGDALELGLGLDILLIGVKETSTTAKLESILRAYLQPKFNSRRSSYSATDKLRTLLQ